MRLKSSSQLNLSLKNLVAFIRDHFLNVQREIFSVKSLEQETQYFRILSVFLNPKILWYHELF
jgi:hypothetical protein